MAVQLQPAPLTDTDRNHCWECGDYVPPLQRSRSTRRYQAVICRNCEPWVRRTLRYRTIQGGQA
jgi:hypothetical protein